MIALRFVGRAEGEKLCLKWGVQSTGWRAGSTRTNAYALAGFHGRGSAERQAIFVNLRESWSEWQDLRGRSWRIDFKGKF
jgi:hypothetical protein